VWERSYHHYFLGVFVKILIEESSLTIISGGTRKEKTERALITIILVRNQGGND